MRITGVLKTDSQHAHAQPSGHGLDNTKLGGQVARDDVYDPTSYRTTLQKRIDGEISSKK
jgi:hypothetical protein